MLSLLLRSAFTIALPGVEGTRTDLREIALLVSVFYLPHWWPTLIACAIDSLSTPADGSMLASFAMHAVALPPAWAAYTALHRRAPRYPVLGLAWAATVVVYYYALMLPVLALTYQLVGLVPAGHLVETYRDVARFLPYEVLFTAGVTTFFLVAKEELFRRRRAERLLRDSEAMLESILQAAPVGIAALHQGRVAWANGQLASLLRWPSPAGLVGVDLASLVDPGAGEAPAISLDPAPREVWLRRKDGTRFAGLLGVARLTGDASPEALTVTVLDVTERLALQSRLAKAQRLESLGQLAGGVAHDFNNLLTMLLGNLHLLEQQAGNASHEIAEMREVVAQGTSMTRQLLAFGRRQASTPRPVSLATLLPQGARMYRMLLGPIQLEIDVAPGTPAIQADPVQLDQVLMNLVINARDAILEVRSSGLVRLEVRPAGPDEGPRQVAISVGDDGAGMDEETRAHIFEPFFTTKPEGKGTGLGLATVYGIVRQHGGSVEVSSVPGQGSTFRLLWPAAADAPPVW